MSACLQCRLCAEWKVGNELINIKHEKAIQLKLESKIQQCLNLNFDNLKLPNNVCLLCCDKVGSTYDFQELVKKAQQSLLDAIGAKIENFKTELPESENEWYQYVETALDDYDDEIVKEVKVEENSQVQVTGEKNNTNVKHEEKIEATSRGNSSTRKKRKKTVLDPEIAKRKALRNAKIQRTKNAMKNYIWKCATCEIECHSVENLRKHFTDEHKQKPIYSCTECSKTYDIFQTFQKHVKAHRDKFRFKCDLCSMHFHLPFLLRNHHLRSHSETNYTCPECGKNFKTPFYLQKHLRYLHPPDVRQKYDCDICGRNFLTTKGLLYHQKTAHSDKRDFSCDQCGKMFVVQSQLQIHLNTVHSDLKPFSCNQCQQTFKSNQILKSHLLVHSNEKRHSCEVCGKRFNRKDILRQHLTVHSGVQKFECEHCNKRFRTKSQLKVHIRQHTGERPYSCLECNHHFADISNYLKHMRGKHGLTSTKKNTPTN